MSPLNKVSSIFDQIKSQVFEMGVEIQKDKKMQKVFLVYRCLV